MDFLSDLKQSMKRPTNEINESHNNQDHEDGSQSSTNKKHKRNNSFVENKCIPPVINTPKLSTRKERKLFIYGNYDRYYGYRNPEGAIDRRLHFFQKEWFDSKQILDIGCNTGLITLAIARDFKPSHIVGIDIDPQLIYIARRNINRYKHTDSSNNNDVTHMKVKDKEVATCEELTNISYVQVCLFNIH